MAAALAGGRLDRVALGEDVGRGCCRARRTFSPAPTRLAGEPPLFPTLPATCPALRTTSLSHGGEDGAEGRMPSNCGRMPTLPRSDADVRIAPLAGERTIVPRQPKPLNPNCPQAAALGARMREL